MIGQDAMNLLTGAEGAVASVPLPPAARATRRQNFPMAGDCRQSGDNAAGDQKAFRNETLELRIELGRAYLRPDEVLGLRKERSFRSTMRRAIW